MYMLAALFLERKRDLVSLACLKKNDAPVTFKDQRWLPLHGKDLAELNDKALRFSIDAD